MIETFKFWFFNQNPIIQALIAGSFTWFITAIGSGLVFFFNSSNRKALDVALVLHSDDCSQLLVTNGSAIEYVEMQKNLA